MLIQLYHPSRSISILLSHLPNNQTSCVWFWYYYFSYSTSSPPTSLPFIDTFVPRENKHLQNDNNRVWINKTFITSCTKKWKMFKITQARGPRSVAMDKWIFEPVQYSNIWWDSVWIYVYFIILCVWSFTGANKNNSIVLIKLNKT